MIANRPLLHTLLLCLFFLTGCSGGESQVAGGGGDGGIEGTGAPVSIASTGSITAFGSVFVNGIEYETNATSITINESGGQPESSLQLGMVVTITGQRDASGQTGTADSIEFDQNLEGPVGALSVTTDGMELTILGTRVLTNDDTVFENVDPGLLATGMVVVVSGFAGNDSLLATRIEKISDSYISGDSLELEGEISSLDNGTGQFTLGSQLVDFSAALVTPASRTLANGEQVEVRANNLVGGTLIADRVKIKNQPSYTSGEVELEGLISNLDTSMQTFSLNGATIDYSGAGFVNGTDGDLANGLKVEAEGQVSALNVINASKIVIKAAVNVKIRAAVSELQPESSSLEILGITIRTDSSTLFKDVSEQRLRFFDYTDINSGDWIDAQGRITEGTFYANRITRRRSSSPALIKGPVTEISGNVLTILGVSVDISSLGDPPGFLATVSPGNVVEAEGSVTGAGDLLADSATKDD